MTIVMFGGERGRFVQFGDLNWDMLNTPEVLQSKIDALNLTQIIKEPTRYNPKSINMGTLKDIIRTNLPPKHLCCFKSGSQISLIHCLNPLWVCSQKTTPHHCQTLPKAVLRV